MPTIPCPFTLPPGATAHASPYDGGIHWRCLDGAGRPFACVVRAPGRPTGTWAVAALASDGCQFDYTTATLGGDMLDDQDADQVSTVLAALLQERIAKTMGEDHVLAQWERDHQAVTAWMDGQP